MLAHFGTLARHTALPRAGWVLFLAEHQTFGELQPDLGLEACAFSPLLSIRRFDGGPRHAELGGDSFEPVSYTPLRAPETVLDLVCPLLLEKKKQHDITHVRKTSLNNSI